MYWWPGSKVYILERCTVGSQLQHVLEQEQALRGLPPMNQLLYASCNVASWPLMLGIAILIGMLDVLTAYVSTLVGALYCSKVLWSAMHTFQNKPKAVKCEEIPKVLLANAPGSMLDNIHRTAYYMETFIQNIQERSRLSLCREETE